MKILIFLHLPLLVFTSQNMTCPQPWPKPSTSPMGESCSCEMNPAYGLQVKCSWVYEWPAYTRNDTGELRLDGTRMNETLYSDSLVRFASNLQLFSCDDCGIKNIQQFAFFGLAKLHTISLQDNSISTITSFAFAGLANLQKLNLKNSGIFTLQENAFFGLNHVNHFDLSVNSLYSIQIGAFRNVSNINQLILNEIKAERIKSYSLKGLKHVNFLSFTHAEVRKLESYSFFGVDNITTITFHSSHLRDISPFAFVGLGKVKTIKLKSTKISTLTCEALEGLDCVRSIEWTLSPIRCDCNIQWMVELSPNISRDVTKGLACASPRQFRGNNPLELGKDELGCNDEERFMGCPPLDTRVPRVKALERYIEEMRGPMSSSAEKAMFSISILFLSITSYLVH